MQVTIDILEEALSLLRTGPEEFAHEMHWRRQLNGMN